MQDISQIDELDGLIPHADQLRTLMPTKEDIFNEKVNSLINTFTSSMVTMNQQRISSYKASLRVDALEPGILDTLIEKFEEQDYKVKTENTTQKIPSGVDENGKQKFTEIELVNLIISWEQ